MENLLDLDYSKVYELNTTSRHYEGSLYPVGELMFNTKTKQFYKSIGSLPNVTRLVDKNGSEHYFCNTDLLIVNSYATTQTAP
jgi:hypothetical protein